MKQKFVWTLTGLFTLLFIGGFILFIIKDEKKNDLYSSRVLLGDRELFVDVADSDPERVRGLSGREMLDRDRGLLFIFEQPDMYGIWMKDMKFPIDVIWVDEHSIIVDIRENLDPLSFPTVFEPRYSAKYVIEVNAGWVKRNDIIVGEKTSFLDVPFR